MPNHHKVDLIIIGAGILGTMHAYHALCKGLSVRLFERNAKLQGASVRNFGQIVPSGMDSKWQLYGRESVRIYQEINQSVSLPMKKEGTVYIASNQEELQLLEELRQVNQNNGYTSELLTKKQCLESYQGLRSDYALAGLYFPEEMTVDARGLVMSIHDYLVQHKELQLHYQTSIFDVEDDSNQVKVRDNKGQVYTADKVMVCSGHELSILYPEVYLNSDLELSKLQVLQTKSQPGLKLKGNVLTGLSIRRYESFGECPSFSQVKSKEDKDALWKKWGVHLIFKQNPDGSIMYGDSHLYADANKADDLGFDLEEEINRYMIQESKKIFDFQDWTTYRKWYGIYSQCKNRDVFVEDISDNVRIVTGIGGKGMTASGGFSKDNLLDFLNS